MHGLIAPSGVLPQPEQALIGADDLHQHHEPAERRARLRAFAVGRPLPP